MASQFCVIDLETTGLDTDNDFILEIGAILVIEDLGLAPHSVPFHQVIQYNRDIGIFEEVVQDMHTKNNLWSECYNSTIKPLTAIKRLNDWCDYYIGAAKDETYATGSNIKFDLTFLHNNGFDYDDYMHYRSVDISSIKVLTDTWAPNLDGKPEAKKLHRSIPDCYDSIAELAYYKHWLWVPND